MSRMTYSLASVVLALSVAGLAGCPGGGVGSPSLSVSQIAFSFNPTVTEDAFSIDNTGGGTLDWSIDVTTLPAWMDVSPLSGSVTDGIEFVTMSLNATASSLGTGVFSGTVTVDTNAGTQNVAVTLVVNASGDLIVDPLSLDFSTATTLLQFTVRNGGTSLLTWSIDTVTDISPAGAWLSLAQGSPTGNTISGSDLDTVQVVVDRAGLDPGPFIGTITVNANTGQSATVAVTMEVPASVGMLSVTPSMLDFSQETVMEDSLSIRNSGTGTITWTITDDLPAWLTAGTLTDDVSTEIDRIVIRADDTGLAPGTFTHTLTVSAVDSAAEPAGSVGIPVTLTVPAPMPVLEVTPSAFILGDAGVEGEFAIRNTGTGTLLWSMAIQNPWITLFAGEPTSGSLTSNTEVIGFRVDRSGLLTGVHQGIILVRNDDDATQNIPVTIDIEVLPPTLAVVPQFLNFSTNKTSSPVAIFNRGTGTVSWNIDTTSLPSWLEDGSGNPLISVTSGSVSGQQTDGISIEVNRLGLAPGVYTFDAPGVLVASNGGDIPITIAMEVSENPTLAVDTGTNPLDGSPNIDLNNVPFVPIGFAESATFSVANVGSGELTWSIDDFLFPDWLTLDALGPLSLEPVDGAFSIRVTIDRGEMVFGPYTHTLTIFSNDDDAPEQEVEITMNVPKRVIINSSPNDIDLGTTGTTDDMLVANFGDPDTVLNFGISSNKPWLFAFPGEGRSIGVVNPNLNADWQLISVSIDRTGLDGSGGGTGTLTIFATSLQEDTLDIDNDGDTTEVLAIRDDDIAPPLDVEVAVQAAELFFESPPARLRVPSQVRYINLMRNLRFEPIPLTDAQLPAFQDNFFIAENNVPLEITETSQFLSSASRLKNDVVLLLDYTGSAYESALIAQQFHDVVTVQFMQEFPTVVLPDFSTFTAAADPLQYMYEACIGKLLDEIPQTYRVSIMEFHDRNQPGRVVIDFTRNDAAGHVALEAALQGINITDHGASETLTSFVDASVQLVSENFPVPTAGSVAPVVPFDDADVRTILAFTDGRTTSDVLSVDDTKKILQNDRTRLLSVAWGEDVNAGPLASVGTGTGGHVYITRALNTGELDPSGVPRRAPSIYTMYDWCSTDLAADACDLSIGQDLNALTVLSYVTLNVVDTVTGRVGASFDDPNDGNELELCMLPDQGEIAGEFEQDILVGSVVGTDAFGLGVNLGQVGMTTEGIVGTTAEAYVIVDHMPRDVVTLELVFAAEQAGVPQATFDITTALAGISGVLTADNGMYENGWTLLDLGPNTEPDANGNMRNTQTYRIDTNGTPMQYGGFGRILQLDLNAPGGTPFNLRLLRVVPTTGNGENREFTHPDGLDVGATAFRAPSFPTPEITPTLLDFGTTATSLFVNVRNIGGSHAPGNIFLDWSVVGDDTPVDDVLVTPFLGRLISTQSSNTVRVDLDRSKGEVGVITDISFQILYETGILEVQGFMPIVVTGTILPPVMTLTSVNFPAPTNQTINFGSMPMVAAPQTLTFNVTNTGQSTMRWFQTNTNPAWLSISGPFPVTGAFPQTVDVVVDRSALALGASVTHAIQLVATTDAGAVVGNTTVTINAQVDP